MRWTSLLLSIHPEVNPQEKLRCGHLQDAAVRGLRHPETGEQQPVEVPTPQKIGSLFTKIKRKMEKEYEQPQKSRPWRLPMNALQFPGPEGRTCGPGAGGSVGGMAGPQLQLHRKLTQRKT